MASGRNHKEPGGSAGSGLETPEAAGASRDAGGAAAASPKAGEKRASDPDREEGVNKLIAEVRKTGLCGNCAIFRTCRLEKRGKGVWYCDDYKPVSE